MRQLPHVTVATVVERDNHFLMVKEHSDGVVVYNQPAGHLEIGESLVAAAVRETLEETGWHVTVHNLLGIYQYTSPANGISYVRVCFIAEADHQEPNATLDAEIIEAIWLPAAQIHNLGAQLRSPMVSRAITDYESGTRYPLELIQL
ncbi:MAG: NUDIX hydrolase [Gammaproteobacteria bacterium]